MIPVDDTDPPEPPRRGVGVPLVSTPLAILHLRLAAPLTPEAAGDLDVKVAAASDAIRDYLKPAWTDPAWDETTAPPLVQQAVLLYLTNLWEHRGDDGAPGDADAACWMAIERLLRRSRDPALA